MSTYLISGTALKRAEYEYSEIEIEADDEASATEMFREFIENDYENRDGSEVDSYLDDWEATDIQKVLEEYEVVLSVNLMADSEDDAKSKALAEFNTSGKVVYGSPEVVWVQLC
jgi:hypothetical protein